MSPARVPAEVGLDTCGHTPPLAFYVDFLFFNGPLFRLLPFVFFAPPPLPLTTHNPLFLFHLGVILVHSLPCILLFSSPFFLYIFFFTHSLFPSYSSLSFTFPLVFHSRFFPFAAAEVSED